MLSIWEENCARLGYYEDSSVNFLNDVSGQPIGPLLRVQESISISNPVDGTDRLSRNVGKS